MAREAFLEKLLTSYEAYFDVFKEVVLEGTVFPAKAVYHSRSERYVLVKSAKLWAMETNEYAYFSYSDTLKQTEFLQKKEEVLRYGLAEVKPHAEHMYSYISWVILADQVDEEVKQSIKKAKFHKTFRFSFHGWTDLRIAVIDLSDGMVYGNHKGQELFPLLKDTYHSFMSQNQKGEQL